MELWLSSLTSLLKIDSSRTPGPAPTYGSAHVLLALLTITLAAKRKLPDRADFFARAEGTLRRRGELEEGLLVGLD